MVESDFPDIVPYGVENLPIVLVSCSNGKEGGMAENGSRRTGAVVRGSGVVGAMNSIVTKCFKSTGRLWFDAVYIEIPSGKMSPHNLYHATGKVIQTP